MCRRWRKVQKVRAYRVSIKLFEVQHRVFLGEHLRWNFQIGSRAPKFRLQSSTEFQSRNQSRNAHTDNKILRISQALVNILPVNMLQLQASHFQTARTSRGFTLILFSTYSSLKSLQLFLIPSMIAWRLRFVPTRLRSDGVQKFKRRLLWIAIRPQ